MRFTFNIIHIDGVDVIDDDRQYASHAAAVAAMWPLATHVAEPVRQTPDIVTFYLQGEDGTRFNVEVEAVYDGSENAAAEAIGRKLDERDFGKTATEIVQAEEYRVERARD